VVRFHHTQDTYRERSIAAALRVILLGDACLRQTDEFGERRVRPERAARQRGGKRRHGSTAVPVERQ
jgi:hypothetical protein